MMQRALADKQSGTTYWPRDILANKAVCSVSLKGYLIKTEEEELKIS